jgi:outer membrane protein
MVSPLGIIGLPDYEFSYDTKWRRKNYLFGLVGLRLSVPIFNAFETRARIRTAKVNLEDAKLAYDEAQQRVKKEIRQAWQSAVTAQKRYEAEAKSEESNALSYSYALKRYDAGMATLFDLSQTHQQWFAASENTLRMKYEYIIRKKILEILTEP